MLTQHIALVPESYGMDLSELARASAALQKQVTRDLAPRWGVTATVDAFPRLDDVPAGYRPIVLTFQSLNGRVGIHLDHNGQPYALIEMTPLWSLHASRACLEMLINPFGLRTASTRSPRSDQQPVELLLEICAPCQDARYGYEINGVLVSDFCTPAYFGVSTNDPRYSFGGSIDAPFQVLPGGHLTFREVLTDRWWRKSYHDDCELEAELQRDGARPAFGAPRVFEGATPAELAAATASAELAVAHAQRAHQQLFTASQAAAQRLRAQLIAQVNASRYANTQFDMKVDMQLASPAAPSTLPPPLPRARESVSPPVETPSSFPSAATSSSPSLAPFSIPSAGPRPSTPPHDGMPAWLRSAALVAGGGLAAIGLLALALQGRDAFLKPRPVDVPPAYAAAPAHASTPAIAPAVAVVPAAVIENAATVDAQAVAPTPEATPIKSSANDNVVDDEDTETRRARRRERRLATLATPVAVPPAPVVQRAAAADPLDSLLNTRE